MNTVRFTRYKVYRGQRTSKYYYLLDPRFYKVTEKLDGPLYNIVAKKKGPQAPARPTREGDS